MQSPSPAADIPPALSIYFDLVRFLAATSVVLFHTWPLFFPAIPIKWPGHEAVVVFFVLSGYVIAYTGTRPGMGLSTYLQHRVARIVPVAYAALLLGVAIGLFMPKALAPEAPLWSTFANMTFIAQSGLISVKAPLNAPFWSLNYEVWYYVIFAAWCFTPRKWRIPATALALLLAGPKILALLPVWLFGVWLFRARPAMGLPAARLLFIATLAACVVLKWIDASDYLRAQLYAAAPFAWRLEYSTQFVYDLLLGVIVTAHFAAAAALPGLGELLSRWRGAIRYLAGYTLSLYLFHMPLAELFTQVLGITSPAVFYAALAACVWALAQFTECRVPYFRALLAGLSARRSGVAST